MAENFWEHIEGYKKYGYDPLSWLGSCTSEIDPTIEKLAARDVRKAGIKVSPSWFDSYYHVEGKTPELTRRVYDLSAPVPTNDIQAKRAMGIFRIRKPVTEDVLQLSAALQHFFDIFDSKLSVSSLSISSTEHQDAQFALLDYIELHRGDKAGYMPATTAITRITDVLRAPDSEIHSNIAMTAAIDTLNLLGCGINSTYRLFPIYDAPSEQMLDTIRSNLDAYTARYNLAWEDYSALKRGKLFYGTSAMATTSKDLPIRYDLVEEGMQILLTNKFGGLCSVSLYTLGRMDSENIIKYEQNGMSFVKIAESSEAAIKNLSEPHFALGKIISKYSPDFGTSYERDSHISAVYPVGPQGLLATSSLAELVNAKIVLTDIPVIDEEIAAFATKEFLVENSTASLNGCHLIIASSGVIALVTDDLKKHNFAPRVIGTVQKKGSPSLDVDMQLAGKYIASKPKLARLSIATALV